MFNRIINHPVFYPDLDMQKKKDIEKLLLASINDGSYIYTPGKDKDEILLWYVATFNSGIREVRNLKAKVGHEYIELNSQFYFTLTKGAESLKAFLCEFAKPPSLASASINTKYHW